MALRPTGRSWFLALVVTLLFASHHFVSLPGDLFGRTLQNALHIPAFAVFGLVLALRFSRWSTWQLIGCCLLIASGLEGLQSFTARSASFVDLGRDMVGSTIAILAVRGPGLNWYRLAGAGVLITLLTAMLPARVLLAYAHRDEMFPMLVDPGSWRQQPLLSSNSMLETVELRVDTGQSEAALRVCWSGDKYPGLHFNETVADWSGYSSLIVELEVEGAEPVQVTAAIGHEGIRASDLCRARVGSKTRSH